ncbi:RNA methyltransferase [Hyphobacterium sp. CCMP332]|nr:RNA methyltransferase [Hyphobacterium sp. CCMP332]
MLKQEDSKIARAAIKTYLYLRILIIKQMDYKNDLKKIQSLKNKKFRKEFKQFIVEGDKIINEAIDSDFKIEAIWLNQDADYKISEKAKQKGIDVKLVGQKWLERAGTLMSNKFGIALLQIPEEKKIEYNRGWVLALDSINDPGNFGTIIRSAEWFGINTIICSHNSVELYNPKVIMASKGSFLRLNILFKDLKEVLSGYQGMVLAADMEGQNIHEMKLETKNGIILMGSESHGISGELEKHINHKIHIPGNGQAESLNLAIATSIILDNLNRLELI